MWTARARRRRRGRGAAAALALAQAQRRRQAVQRAGLQRGVPAARVRARATSCRAASERVTAVRSLPPFPSIILLAPALLYRMWACAAAAVTTAHACTQCSAVLLSRAYSFHPCACVCASRAPRAPVAEQKQQPFPHLVIVRRAALGAQPRAAPAPHRAARRRTHRRRRRLRLRCFRSERPLPPSFSFWQAAPRVPRFLRCRLRRCCCCVVAAVRAVVRVEVAEA